CQGRQGRLLLPKRAEVQHEVRDVRLQRQGEPRRRCHVARRLRAEGVDCHRRGKDRRAREESGKLRSDLAAGCTQPTHGRTRMLLIREIMYCKPGKVRPLVEKFLAMAKLSAKVGMPKMRVMTDVCSDRYWMLVAEMEVANMAEFERMMQGGGQNSEDMK